jgi:kumamolisin
MTLLQGTRTLAVFSEVPMVKLPGSMPAPMADAHSIGPVPADERFQITVVLRPRADLALHAMQAGLSQRQYLTREQYAARHGASDEDLDACTGWGSPIGSKVLAALGG